MIRLAPEWALNFDDFWNAVKRRNLWFIRLRYAAAPLLLAFAYAANFTLGFVYTDEQRWAIWGVTASIVAYNAVFHAIRPKLKCQCGYFNVLHLSLLQIVLDLAALTLLVYFTGGVESPFLYFYVFHMVIGAMVLPGWVMYLTAAQTFAAVVAVAALEFYEIIPHHQIEGLFATPLYDNGPFLVILGMTFAFLIFMSVTLANGVARQIYLLEKNLFESLEKLRETEQSKQKYIMAVVHEIKTPLAGVSSNLHVVLSKMLGSLSWAIEERLERALIRTNEAVGLINDVLKISRLRLVDQVYNEDIDLDDLIEHTIAKYRAPIEAKRIALERIDERATKRPVKGDRNLLAIAFSNIVGNAVKYGGDDGALRIALKEQETGAVEIRFSDRGVGIPQEDLVNIFDDFYRASNVKRSKIEGTGMGLSLVKQIVQNHKGAIDIMSPSELGDEERPGTAFVVILPTEEQ